jgi:hypothetical protein
MPKLKRKDWTSLGAQRADLIAGESAKGRDVRHVHATEAEEFQGL